MGYVLASLLNDTIGEADTLVVQTDTLAPITVATATDASHEIGGVSVTSNAGGSFDVFYSLPSSSGLTTEYEQPYSAGGDPLGSAVAISAGSSSTQSFLAATATASGGYVLASELTDATSETTSLLVQTDKLGPITVTTAADGLQYIFGASVTSNADGSFDVFWATLPFNSASSSYGPETEYEQAYSASGNPLGSAVAIGAASSVTQSFLAATATASGGYILASGVSDSTSETDTLLVQTDKLAPITVTTVTTNGEGSPQFAGASVTSNADGSFEVFWSLYSSTIGDGGLPVSSSTEYEQAYSASGEPLGSAIAIFSGSPNQFVADAIATASAGTPPPTGDNAILLQNVSGQAAIWDVSGASLTSSALLGANPGPNWKDVGTGDFNDDMLPDILLQNTNGAIAIWETNGTSVTSSAVVANPGPSWKTVGTGDFNDDGHSDILLQNTNGAVAIWDMNGANGTTVADSAVVANPGANWKAVGTGDFNDDGHSDILLQNTNGAVAIWEMNGANGTTVADSAVVANPGANWKVVGTGDFNGDGHSDILLQNTNGNVAIWEMSGVSATSSAVLGDPGPNWHAIGTNGGSDILLQNTSGQTAIWDTSGTNITGSGAVSANAGPNWRAVGLT